MAEMETHSPTPCLLCGRNDPEMGLACRACLNRVDDDLAAIPTLTALAADAVTPSAGAQGGGARGKPGSRPPIDLDAVDGALGLDSLPILEAWERMWREWRSLSPYGPVSLARSSRQRRGEPPATLVGCVAFLRAHLALMAEARDFPLDDYAREVAGVRRRLNRFDPARKPAAWRVPCPAPHADGDGRLCGWRLAIDRDDLRAAFDCPACHSPWTADRLLLVALADPTAVVWATLGDCEAVTGVNARTLRRWAEAGHVGRRGGMYDVGSALRACQSGGAS
jgi:hypothetical protein